MTMMTYFNPKIFKQKISSQLENWRIIKTNKKISYYNVPIGFDIETSSFYINDKKFGIMYEWTFGIDNYIVYGRRWDEFIELYNILTEVLKTYDELRAICYIQNFGFEFQFFRKMFKWKNVFAIDTRKPVYAITEEGIEFRCSYILSGYSLENIGKNLVKYKCEKMVGDLDYSKIRHYKTILTDDELKYCENDVQIILNYIREKIENDGDITKIPLTKTSYVRKYCKNACYYEGSSHKKMTSKFKDYSNLMRSLTLDVDEYKQLKRAFMGGFTHASSFYSNIMLNNVHSYDLTSAYPFVMLTERYPMSKAERYHPKNMKDFKRCLSLYCCIFDIEFYNIEANVIYENYIPSSKCIKKEGHQENNGRIVRAEKITTTITEQDFIIIERFYKWDKIKISNFKRYKKGYLPKDILLSLLEFYNKKTLLKGVEGMETEYLNSKEMVNSFFGMCVTDICRDENIYIQEWETQEPDMDKAIDKYNKSLNRFLFYPWGVWITAYNRKNLFTAIYHLKDDYVYSDTDSVKILNREKHEKYFEEYNKIVMNKIHKISQHYNIDEEKFSPKTIEGEVKTIGIWDYEGLYTRFKTVGAKRYMTEKNGEISMTVSGVNKKCAIPYLLAKYGRGNIFKEFNNGLTIPNKNDLGIPIYDKNGILINNPTGKMTHTYIDEMQEAVISDYNGVSCYVCELSSIHLENAEYTLSLSDRYVEYLLGIQEYEK